MTGQYWGPVLDHGHVAFLAVGAADVCDGVGDLALSGGGHGNDFPGPGEAEGQHDVVFEDAFGDAADVIARDELVAGLGDRGEVPDGFHVEGVEVEPALEEESGLFGEEVQGVLESVVDLGEEAGSECDAQHVAGEFDGVVDLESGGAFVDLEVGAVAAHADDLAFEAFVADDGVGDFILHDRGVEFHRDQVSVYAFDASFLKFRHVSSRSCVRMVDICLCESVLCAGIGGEHGQDGPVEPLGGVSG